MSNHIRLDSQVCATCSMLCNLATLVNGKTHVSYLFYLFLYLLVQNNGTVFTTFRVGWAKTLLWATS